MCLRRNVNGNGKKKDAIDEQITSLKLYDTTEKMLDELLDGVAHTILLALGCVLLRHFGTAYIKRAGSGNVYFSPRIRIVLKKSELRKLEADPLYRNLAEFSELSSVKTLLQEYWNLKTHYKGADDWEKISKLIAKLDRAEGVDVVRLKMIKEAYDLVLASGFIWEL